ADTDRAIFGDASLTDYAIEFNARVATTINHAVTAEVRYDSATGNSYRVDFADASHALGEGVHIYYNTGGGDTLLGTLAIPTGFDISTQHTYRVEVEGKNIRAYVDGTLLGVVSDQVTGVGDLAAGQATVRTDDDGEAVFWDNIKLTPLSTANGVGDLLNTSLASLGVTTANSLMTNLENVVTDVATPATLQELLDNLEAVDGMKAALVGGRLQVYAEDPRKDFGLGEAGGLTTGTITKVLFGLNAAQFTQSQPSGTAVVTAASTDEYTVADTVIPLHGGSPSFHTATGAEGTGLDYLFTGGILYGTGINRSFVNGEESLYTSAKISAGVDTAARVDGGYNVGSSGTSLVTEPSSTLVARSIFPDAKAGRYTIEYNYDGAPSAWHYRILNADGEVQGNGVLGSSTTPATFASYIDSDLAGSTFTHTYPGAGPPASGQTFEFVLKLDTSASLADAGFATPATTATNGVFTINGVAIQISDYTTETVESILAKINGSGAGVVARYDSRDDRFIVASTTIGSSGTVLLGSNTDSSNFLQIAKLTTTTGGTAVAGVDNNNVSLTTQLGTASTNLTTPVTSGTFTINGVTLYVDASKDTLQDVIDRINGSGAHVKASYDSSTDRFVLQSDMDDESTTTNTTRIRVGAAGDSSNILQALHIGTASQQQTTRYVGEAGTDAKFTFDGTTYTRVSNTVTNLVEGLTLTLLAASDKTLTINVEVDTDRGMNALADFVAKYNEIVDLLNPAKLTDDQKKYLTPLTDEDRANMTYTEIETYTTLYEKYRRQELIRTDSALRRIMLALRRAVTSSVSGLPESMNGLIDLGIDTYLAPGKVVTDGTLVYDSTDKDEILKKLGDIGDLEEMLRTREDAILQLFASEEYTGSGTSVLATYLVDRDSGLMVPADGQALSFRVGDGINQSSSITLQAGRTYTQAQILELLDRAGLNVGDGDDFGDRVRVTASFDSQGRLLLRCTGSGDSRYQVVLRDDSRGTNTLATVFGIDISSDGKGLSRALTDLLSTALKSDGVLGYRVKTDGTIEKDIDRVEDSITAYEARLKAREEALNRQFTAMESMLSQLQSQGDYVLSTLSSASKQSSGSS
ncbi:MAG TPA: flagellar filament capping protein FliD, partial [Armatimonadota bacterium]|nr:flagellar filament capping protein FliD [Armatimonadota bacterium]